MKASDLRLYLVTDRQWLGTASLEAQVDELLASGVTFLQYREKELSWEENLVLASALGVVAKKHGVPYVINDDVALALASEADGVHVGQNDLEAGQVRRLIGPNRILGVSVSSVDEALRAKAAGADYLGVGAVFQTGTKNDASAVSHETLRAICTEVDLPVVAIGGIHSGNLLKLKGTGVDGVAVISAILAQDDPEAAAKALGTLTLELVSKGQQSPVEEMP